MTVRNCKSILYAVLSCILVISGCKGRTSPPAPQDPVSDGTYTVGEFSFSYPPEKYSIEDEASETQYSGTMTSLILRSREKPFNRIEFAIFRYDPEFVAGIMPKEIVGELKADVVTVGERVTEGLEVTEQSGLVCPDEISLPYEVTNILHVRDHKGEDAYVRVTSAQREHYNIITIAWGDNPETIRSYVDILASFSIHPPQDPS